MLQNEKFEKIVFPIKNDLDIFEKNLEKIINKQDNFLKNDLHDFIFTKPKRLRPIFVFLFSKILNISSQNEKILNIALALELIHSASLIHDDILDEAVTRRSVPTFYKKYNSKIAVLEGDLLLSMALEVLSRTSVDIFKIFSKKIQETILGELEQNSTINQKIDEKTYLKKTFNKTGNLFIAGLEALFCLGEFDKKTKENLINYLKNFSLAFQLKNDTEDIKADIKNGNFTLVVLYFLIDNSIQDLNNNPDFEKYKKQAFEKIDEYKISALKNLDNIENSIYKTSLIELTNLTLRNKWKK